MSCWNTSLRALTGCEVAVVREELGATEVEVGRAKREAKSLCSASPSEEE
jgi:hypothetical protein